MKNITFLLLLIMPMPAVSYSGNEWLLKYNSDDVYEKIIAWEFLHGMLTAYANVGIFNYCFNTPDGVTNSQLSAIVAKQLNENPEIRHHSMAVVAPAVFRTAFGEFEASKSGFCR